MSAAPAMALIETPRRAFARHPVNVPLDLIVLRSGVPENLPGRCTDISDAGVGAVVAGELVAGPFALARWFVISPGSVAAWSLWGCPWSSGR
jgi:hypothetical protein